MGTLVGPLQAAAASAPAAATPRPSPTVRAAVHHTVAGPSAAAAAAFSCVAVTLAMLGIVYTPAASGSDPVASHQVREHEPGMRSTVRNGPNGTPINPTLPPD